MISYYVIKLKTSNGNRFTKWGYVSGLHKDGLSYSQDFNKALKFVSLDDCKLFLSKRTKRLEKDFSFEYYNDSNKIATFRYN